MEIFTDSLVLQHKALAMVPIIFGVVGILRGAGVIERARTTVLVPVLAVLAGASLFVHFHDGHFHMDVIYIQHAAMGATAVSAGVMLFLARRTARGEAVIRWAWPGVLALLGLLLLVYVEA